MKKSYFFKFLVFTVIGALFTVTSCKDYDDDISRLDRELGNLKTELTNQLTAIKAEMNTAIDAKVKTVSDELTSAKTKLTTLEAKVQQIESTGGSKEELDAVKSQIGALKAEILEKTVSLEAYNAFRTDLAADLTALAAKVTALETNSATKAEVAALKAEITIELGTLKNQLDALDVRVTALENSYQTLLAKHNEDIQDLIEKLAELKAELNPRITTIEALLEIADGESGVLNSIAANLADQLAKIGANADAIALLRSDLENELADQLALIEANKTAIEDLAADLAAKYAALEAADEDLQKQITDNYNELDGKITVNKEAIEALDLRVTAIEDELLDIWNAIGDLEDKIDMKIMSVFQSLDKRVTSLTFIPDYTSEDGTPQIVVRGLAEWRGAMYRPEGTPKTSEYWEQKNEGTIYKGITILKYKVSPKNVSLSDFEVERLVQKSSLVRSTMTSSEYIVLAGQATYYNGILSVPVVVEANTYDMDEWGSFAPQTYMDEKKHNISVALQVRNLNSEYDKEEDRIVTSSEYVKANFDFTDGRIALNDKSSRTPGTLLPYDITYNTIAGGAYGHDIVLWNGKSQSGNTADILNHTINLNDYILGVFEDFFGDWVSMKEFGFNAHKFHFRLVTLPTEGVDQTNTYVTLNSETGVIGVKPDGNTVNQAAVGRTPIVEVTAIVNGKVHAVGYIKILISDAFDNSDINFTFTLEDYVLGCNSTYELTNVDIAAIDFDKVFNHDRINLGKDAFFAEYNQIALTDAMVTKVTPPTPASATVGAMGGDPQHVEFGWATDPETQSVNLYNYLQANIRNDAPVGSYEVKTRLKSNGYRPDVVITWKFKVVLPTDISLIPNTIYYKNGGIVVNPTIFEQGALTSTAYEALLNNTFMHESNNFDFEGLTQTCQDYLTPYFVFTEVPTGFTISSDKKSVWKGSDKAAEIVKDGYRFFVRLNNIGEHSPVGPWGNHTPFSDAAKQLVGKTVKIQPRAYINNQPLNEIPLYTPFTVMFRKPLSLNFPDNAVVYDQANDGVKNIYTLNLYSPSIIKDWNGKSISVLTNEGRDLINHYEIDFDIDWIHSYSHHHNWGTWEYESEFRLGDPQINLQADGTIGTTYRDIPLGTDMKISIHNIDGHTYTHPSHGQINVPALIKFKWSNSSTGEVQNEFMVRIPVYVKHKWSPAAEPLMDYLFIKVKPGNGL